MIVDPFCVEEVARVEVGVDDYAAEGECLMREGNCVIFIIFDIHINKINILNKIGDLHTIFAS